MARKKTPTVRANVKAMVSSRLREIRQEIFGDHGGPELARKLGLPARTWYNYETGVTVPAEVLLSFIDQTNANPIWLLSGEGPRYRRAGEDAMLAELSPVELIRRGLEKLEQSANRPVIVAPENVPGETMSDFVAVKLVPGADLLSQEEPSDHVEGHILAYRQWLPNPEATVGVRLEDDSMEPILPKGSIVAIDRSTRDPQKLQGRMVAALQDGQVQIRWLDVSDRHLLLRANRPGGKPAVLPLPYEEGSESPILGHVVWSWSRFSSP